MEQLEHEPNETRHGTALLVVKKTGIREAQDPSFRFEFAPALRENIAYPLRLGAIGERNNKFVATPEDEHRSVVFAMRFTSLM